MPPHPADSVPTTRHTRSQEAPLSVAQNAQTAPTLRLLRKILVPVRPRWTSASVDLPVAQCQCPYPGPLRSSLVLPRYKNRYKKNSFHEQGSGMGSLLRQPKSRESVCFLSEPASSTHNTRWAFFSVFVHSLSSASPCLTHLRTCFSHKPFALHSPFYISCGSRGKQGLLNSSTHPVFQFPSIPQPRFRNLNRLPTLSLPVISATFPLFLPERRVLLSFSLSLIRFPLTRCTAHVHLQTCHSPAPNPQKVSAGLSKPIDPGNPEKNPSFPPPILSKGEYNQEEEEKTVSVRWLLVVQCGQRGICFNRFLR